MLLLPLMTLLAAQVPATELAPVAVVLTSQRHGSELPATRVAERVLETCRREGITLPFELAGAVDEFKAAGVADPRSCNGTTACLARLAVVLGARAVVVGVDVALVAGQLSIHLEAIAAGSTTPLATADLLAPAGTWGDVTVVGITHFARQVKEGLAPRGLSETKPPLVQDAPRVAAAKPSLDPVAKPPPPAALTYEAPRSRTAATVTAIGGGVALVAAAGFLIAGLADKSQYDAGLFTTPDGAVATHLPETQARALAASTNGKLIGAVVAAAAGAALGGISVYLFTRPSAPSRPEAL